jgi:hypothetical protein
MELIKFKLKYHNFNILPPINTIINNAVIAIILLTRRPSANGTP